MPLKLTTKLALLSGVPIAGLILSIAGSASMSRTTGREIAKAKDESAVHAMLAQRMQFDVVQVQQWLTDISATRGRDGLADGFEKADESKRSFDAGLAQFDEMFAREGDAEGRRAMADLKVAIDEYYDQGRAMAQAYVADGTEAGNARMGAFDGASERLQAALTPFVAAQVEEFNTGLASLASGSAWTMRALVFGGLALLGVTVVMGWAITRSITAPINSAVASLSEGAGETVSAAGQVATSAQSLAQGATEQAAALEQTSASMEEMGAMTRQNASHSGTAAKQMGEIDLHVVQSNHALGDMVASMSSIQESSSKVSRIIKTIDEIAFQTNILALNAAVEAARAGEAGLGFAVVADEVRNLAQRSAQAARDTSALIEESIGLSAAGAHKLDRVATSISAITGDVASVKVLIEQVSEASRQQAEGIAQVSQAIAQMEKVTQGTAATAEESAAASEELSAQAETTMASVRTLAAMVDGSAGPTARVGAPPRRTAPVLSLTRPGTRGMTGGARADARASHEATGTFGTF